MTGSTQFNSRSIIRDDAKALIEQAVARSRGLSQICRENNVVTGALREILAYELLEQFLPPYLRIARGAVTNSLGQLSPEVDLAIVDTRVLPTFLAKERVGLIPLESLVAAVEVKPDYESDHVRQAQERSQSFRQLRIEYLPHLKRLPESLMSLFCFSGKAPDRPESAEGLNAVVVAGSGSWIYVDDHWAFQAHDDEYEEVKRWLAIMIDNCRTRAEYQWQVLNGLTSKTLAEFSASQHRDYLGSYIRSQPQDVKSDDFSSDTSQVTSPLENSAITVGSATINCPESPPKA